MFTQHQQSASTGLQELQLQLQGVIELDRRRQSGYLPPPPLGAGQDEWYCLLQLPADSRYRLDQSG